MIDLSKYKLSEAMNYVCCRHAIGRNGRDYEMPCIVLHKTKSGTFKVIVFGDRFWDRGDIASLKRIRYVNPDQLLFRQD